MYIYIYFSQLCLSSSTFTFQNVDIQALRCNPRPGKVSIFVLLWAETLVTFWLVELKTDLVGVFKFFSKLKDLRTPAITSNICCTHAGNFIVYVLGHFQHFCAFLKLVIMPTYFTMCYR